MWKMIENKALKIKIIFKIDLKRQKQIENILSS